MASVHLTKHANLCANCEEKQSFFHENPLKWQNLHDWIEKRERRSCKGKTTFIFNRLFYLSYYSESRICHWWADDVECFSLNGALWNFSHTFEKKNQVK